MKREIIFRGMDENGKWAYGDAKTLSSGNIERIVETGRNRWVHTVDPDTVGQATGLKDKNGKMIFEGDILESPNWACHCKIEWREGGFVMPEGETAHNLEYELRSHREQYEFDYEIVGNIHEEEK
jgi:uncharacterized phage protein (TIGR01671 family)